MNRREPAEPRLVDRTVVVLGGTSGIGLATARRAREEGASLILTARDPDRLSRVGLELDASISAFDLADERRPTNLFTTCRAPRTTCCSRVAARATYPSQAWMRTRSAGASSGSLSIRIAALAKDALAATGSLLLIGGTGGRRPSAGPLIAAVTAATPALARSLTVELAPIHVNVIAAGFVDTPLSAALLGDELDTRREHLGATLPTGRVVGPDDVAALAVELMANTAVTGAAFDIDGGQQLVEG